MAHLNYFPPKVASVNSASSKLSRWWWLLELCKMQNAVTNNRRRIEQTKLWVFLKMETVATNAPWLMAMAVATGSCHGLVPSFFEEMTRCRCQKHRQSLPGNSNGRLKFRKYHAYLPMLRFKRARLMWLQEIAQTARSRCQKHRWQ